MRRYLKGLGAFLTLLLMMGGGTVTAYADTYVVLPNDPAMSLYFPHHDSVEFYESHSEGASKQPMILVGDTTLWLSDPILVLLDDCSHLECELRVTPEVSQ